MSWLFEIEPPNHVGIQESKLILDPFRESLAKSVLRGFADWFEFMSPDGRGRTKSCSVAICVNNFIEERVKEALLGEEGIVGCRKANFFKIFVGDKIVLRFKKLTDEYLVMPPRTEQGKDWYSNRPVDDVPSEFTRLNIGYSTTPLGEEITDIAVTFQLSTKALAWKYSILDPADIRSVFTEYSVSGQDHLPEIPLNLKSGKKTEETVVKKSS